MGDGDHPLAAASVLVTGHTGFKGSWLCLWLAELGARVSGLALAPAPGPTLFEAARVAERLAADHRVDVRDDAAVASVVAEAAPEVVFHLAAQPLVRAGHRRPVETFATNVVGTAAVLEAIRRRERPCAVVVVTSDKCYEAPAPPGGHGEGDRLGGADPYSASKAGAELVAAAFRQSFFPPGDAAGHGVLVATARAGNVIGGGDWSADRIVPDAIRALAAGRPVPVRNPASVRPWQHVLEPLAGYLRLAERLLMGDPSAATAWNLGPAEDACVPVAELVEAICRRWGDGSWEHRPDADAAPEAEALRLATERAHTQLGWRPRWSLSEAVDRTVDWYRAHHDGGVDLRARSLADIAAYRAAEGRAA